MPRKSTRPASAEPLNSQSEMAAYWARCVAQGTDDPACLLAALGDIARVRGIGALAKKTGLSRVGLYKALSPGGNPEFATVLKVIHALGLALNGASPHRRSRPRRGRSQSEAARRADEAERDRIRHMSAKDRALLALDLGERLGGFGRRTG